MERGTVTDKNREFLLSEFIDNIVMNLPVSTLQQYAAEYLHLDYSLSNNEELQACIQHRYPHILDESLPCPYRRD